MMPVTPGLFWYPSIAGIEEIYQLTAEEQHQLIKESSYVTEKLKDIFAADKMNVAALGNIVRQLHVHHVVQANRG